MLVYYTSVTDFFHVLSHGLSRCYYCRTRLVERVAQENVAPVHTWLNPIGAQSKQYHCNCCSVFITSYYHYNIRTVMIVNVLKSCLGSALSKSENVRYSYIYKHV